MIAFRRKMPVQDAPAFYFTYPTPYGAADFCKALWAIGFVICLMVSASPVLAQSEPSQQSDAQAQPQIARQPTIQLPRSVRPTPSQLELSKLLWSTIAAVDHANQSGNYSVLRDISAQGFQIQFNPARLTELFAGLRRLDVDLSNAFLVPPTYYEAPQMVAKDTFRARGLFQLRPVAIQFEAYYQWEQGRWKLFGIELKPQEMSATQPATN